MKDKSHCLLTPLVESVLMEISTSFQPGSPDEEGRNSRLEALLSEIQKLNVHHGLGFLNGVLPDVNSLVRSWSLYTTAGCAGGVDKYGNSVQINPAGDAQYLWRLLKREALDYEQRFSELMAIIGFQLTPEERLKEEYKFSLLSFANGLISQFKISINVLFADFFGTDRPEFSQNDCLYSLFPRRLRHFLKAKVVSLRGRRQLLRKNCELVYTIFQGLKKGLLPIRPHQVDESLLKHCKALTQSPEVREEILDAAGEILEEEFSDLPRFLSRAEGGRDRCLMSCKAVIDGPCAAMGQVGIAVDLLDSEISALSHPVLLGHFREGPNEGLVIVPNSRFDDRWLRKVLKLNNWLHKPRVMPQVILEPLKGRIITKPDAGQYIEMNSTQKKLWRYLQRFPQFALSGRPVTIEDIWYVGKSWDVGKKFVSGDFSAATDNLKGELSKLVLDFVLSRFRNPDLVYQMRSSFLNSDILYRDCFKAKRELVKIRLPDGSWKEKKRDTLASLYGRGSGWLYEKAGCAAQSNGQLMGHVLSFPILCLVNYLVFRLVFRDLGRDAPNVLVNGDDILFCATPTEYQLWKERTTECGLIPSLGKNLFSDRIAQINSVLFKVSTGLYPDGLYHLTDVREVNYLSFGLLVQRGKGKDQTFTMERTTPGDLDLSTPYKMVAAMWEVWGRLCVTSIADEGKLWDIFRGHWKREWRELSRVGLDPRDRSDSNRMRFELLGNQDSSAFLRDVSSISSYAVGQASALEPQLIYAWRRKLLRVARSHPDPNAEVLTKPRRRTFRA